MMRRRRLGNKVSGSNFFSCCWDVQGAVADEKVCVVPSLDDELLTLLVVVKEAVAETQVGEVAFRDG